MINSLIPPALCDYMVFSSKKLFNASQDGNLDYAVATMKAVIKTLTVALEELERSNTSEHN